MSMVTVCVRVYVWTGAQVCVWHFKIALENGEVERERPDNDNEKRELKNQYKTV